MTLPVRDHCALLTASSVRAQTLHVVANAHRLDDFNYLRADARVVVLASNESFARSVKRALAKDLSKLFARSVKRTLVKDLAI